jgi:predicted unusual protein kinase regulating ubiquinone biosynthesis (AarF/ABC1/UbiB family)/nucleotide-binding universal stress UspA family protein
MLGLGLSFAQFLPNVTGWGAVIDRILVATDQSETATRAVAWAAEMSDRYAAQLLVLQVIPPEHLTGSDTDSAAQAAADQLAALTRDVGGDRGRPLVVYDSDPADAIVRACEDERVDLVVVGNVGMRDRTEFLLGSVPNRVSHNARCSVVIVNTAITEVPQVPRQQAQPGEAAPTEGQLLGRAAHVAQVFAKYGLGEVLHRGQDDITGRARRFRDALEELGPTFAKLGQILSTRPDLLPAAVVDELASLQDHVASLSEAEIVAVMEKELKVPWEDVFASIESDPMASGTIAQVHRATLVGGERVVVKVQRPTAETEIRQDLGLLQQFAAKAGQRPAFQQVLDVPAIIEHLSSSLLRELDFRHEAANIERMRQVLASFDRLGVPRVHTGLSTGRLLVMEEIQGIPVLQAPAGDARREAARQLLEAYYHQVLAAGFFHADPHPGNLMWWDQKIYLLDLGMVGEVDAGVRESLLLLLLAFWQEDTEFLADAMLALAAGLPPTDFDKAAFQADLTGLLASFRHQSLKELRLGPLLQQLTEISVRHRIKLPSSLALIGKAFGQMQMAAAELDPSLDPFSVAGSFYMRQLAGQARTLANPRQLFYETQKIRVRASRLLEGLERAIGTTSGPGLQVELRGVQELTDAIGSASRRNAIGLAAATAILGTAITARAPHSRTWLTATFGTAAVLLTGGALAGVTRRR